MIQSKNDVLYAKEVDDFGQVLEVVAKGIATGKGVTELIASVITPAIEAFSGFDKVDDEFNENVVATCETIGARMGRLVGVIIEAKRQVEAAKAAQPVVEAPAAP